MIEAKDLIRPFSEILIDNHEEELHSNDPDVLLESILAEGKTGPLYKWYSLKVSPSWAEYILFITYYFKKALDIELDIIDDYAPGYGPKNIHLHFDTFTLYNTKDEDIIAEIATDELIVKDSCLDIHDYDGFIKKLIIEGYSEIYRFNARKCEEIIFRKFTSPFILQESFLLCSSVKSLHIPEGVISIGYKAFASCYGLEELTLPNTLTSIGAAAFVDCKNLSKVIIIPNKITSIGEFAFGGLGKITELYYKGSKKDWKKIKVDKKFAANSNINKVICFDGEIKI